jgi:hypothetical protein
MQSKLSGTHLTTYHRILEHPLPHNLQWREVWSMFHAMGDATAVEDDEGILKIERNGEKLVLHRPRGKDMGDDQELLQVRHFLERSGAAAPPPYAAGAHLLVVIDHREARIYRTELHGSIPERLMPYDPFGFGRSLHYNQDHANGQRKPERKNFYEAVIKTLRGAKQILLFGTGTGASSAMERLLDELKVNHKELAECVVRSVAIDAHHLSDDQLLAKAREFFVVQ